ncbi:uncharacterized protein LOC136090731 [Hydra vulgaris]|uniref:Uncharacterized protein LOC136090731 n=1 Tax=Hydra vulgaris TaxID=6087 RepID=A0ABM4DGT5_HYDVU
MEKYYWPNISGDIKKWVKECSHCQKSGQLLSISEPLHSIKSELFKLDMLICCIVANFHWTLTIINPRDRTIHYMNPMGKHKSAVIREEIKWNSYLSQRYGVNTKFKIYTSMHAKQDDSVSCGVFCLKFAENVINGEELVHCFPVEEVNNYRERVVQLLLDEGGQKCWYNTVCRICGNIKGPKTRKKQKLDEWIKCDICIPNRWYHIECIAYETKNSISFCCGNIHL